ncbi:hypothetical protein [Endozoicomonas sp. SCSIO W0465]|uniref:hypothetical protein n=1 Tax=Endozoicomonas sp. SCSIO W0465 TaxID=2918516 RepID=UPI002075E9C3|nr:hypothetical protein [Endozoicomonas sp. SCSIO W0465]USE39279.1 hypothetical protein MJO57_14600 [Endozoicomonas sp. SCSIO W0465]
MSTPISRSASANAINTSHLDESLYQAKVTRNPGHVLFHGRSTREFPKPVNMTTFTIEDETAGPCQSAINDRSFNLRKEHVASHSSLTPPQSKMADSQIGVRQNRLTAPSPDSSSSLPPNNRAAYIINLHTLGLENGSLPSDGSEPGCLKNLNWWERNKQWNSTFIISTLAAAATVTASLISDIIDDGDHALFQRSGSVIVCWALLVTFITLRKRSEKLPSHQLMIESPNQRISRKEGMTLRELSEAMGNARITERRVKRTASECDWVILLASIIGTLIWGYGDLIVK